MSSSPLPTPYMTLEEFRSTRRLVNPQVAQKAGYEVNNATVKVLLYCETFYIERLESGMLYLITEKEEYQSFELEPLERALYDYAVESEALAGMKPRDFDLGAKRFELACRPQGRGYTMSDLLRLYGEQMGAIRAKHPKGCVCAIGKWTIEPGEPTVMVIPYAVREPDSGWRDAEPHRVLL